ncbi:hypothetical protein BDR07DRAFT_1374536 [Suillus spraguei]|nr:hypothetical protein BDR07DRAFT_1374536 [Suillus spraguei]
MPSNLTSLTIVEEAFPGDNNVTQPDMPSGHEASITLSDTINIAKDRTRWIKAEICRQLMTASLGSKFLLSKKFPWNTIPVELTHQGMMMMGYPEDIILPGEYHASKSKGIANLTLKEASFGQQTRHILIQILISECPVVMGTYPPVDSIHAARHCLFTNRTSDHKKLAHEKPSKAITKRKGKTFQDASVFCDSPLTLSDDSGNSDSNGSTCLPNIPIGRPPAHKFKVVQLPKQQKVMKPKEVMSLISSDAKSGSGNGTTKANPNYKDKATSKKQKAKSEGSS